jgi:signal transduction histidine kinase
MFPNGQAKQTARRLLTTRMALAIGFGVLLTLLFLSGIDAVHVISQLQSSNESILEGFLGRQMKLDQLRSAIYLSGTYVRDYLLEPDPAKAEQSRIDLADTRGQIQKMVSLTAPEPDPMGQEMHTALQRVIQEYWQTLDPVLTWDAQRRHAEGFRFLHDEVLPRRSSTLGITDTIASVNQQQVLERNRQIVQMFAGLRNRLIIGVLVMFLCGLALAFATALQILRLEDQMLAHLTEVTHARQELRKLSARLVDTQENERKNISRELHDAVGQSMSAAQFELHGLGLALAPHPEALRVRVDRIRELVECSVAMVRNMALLLRPSMLDDLGLSAALEWQANQVSRATGLSIQMIADDLPGELPEEHKICIFRVVQEALNNVCRHARASSVVITMVASDAGLSVAIRDDGRGFVKSRGMGLGLIGMQERVEGLGGSLAIHSNPGKGTSIDVSLPLPGRAAVGRATAESMV